MESFSMSWRHHVALEIHTNYKFHAKDHMLNDINRLLTSEFGIIDIKWLILWFLFVLNSVHVMNPAQVVKSMFPIHINRFISIADIINTLWTEQHGRYLTDGILNFIFLNKNCYYLIQITQRSNWQLRQHWFRLWFDAEQLVRHYIALSIYRGHFSSYNLQSFSIVIVVLCAISYHIAYIWRVCSIWTCDGLVYW